MKREAIACMAAMLALAGAPAWAVTSSDADAALALACSTCHAASSASAGIPRLRGPASRLLADLRAFRDGTRTATIMDRITRGYSDDELARIAEFIAASRVATDGVAD